MTPFRDDPEHDDYEDSDDWEDYSREPTEQEMLTVYVEDDAYDPDSHALDDRQQDRWARFLERQQRETERAMEALAIADQPPKYPRPTWWKLWTPPAKLDLSNYPNRPKSWEIEDNRLIKQGDLALNHERKTEDINAWHGDRFPLTVLRSATTYLDFTPDLRYGIPDLAFLGTVTRANMIGKWGYYEPEKNRFRSRVFASRTKWDPDYPEWGVTELAVKLIEPPPYGFWMPTFIKEDLDGSHYA